MCHRSVGVRIRSGQPLEICDVWQCRIQPDNGHQVISVKGVSLAVSEATVSEC